MKKDDLFLILMALLLLLGVVATLLWGKGKSRHGFGHLEPSGPAVVSFYPPGPLRTG